MADISISTKHTPHDDDQSILDFSKSPRGMVKKKETGGLPIYVDSFDWSSLDRYISFKSEDAQCSHSYEF